MSPEPLALLWDRLEAAGCRPRGEVWKGTAHCPHHDDRSPSLSFGEGYEPGVAVLHCHAGGRPTEVLATLGLTLRDLFPAGHRKARRPRELVPARPPVEMVLEAVRRRDMTYHCTAEPDMWVLDLCPSCLRRPVLLHADEGGELRLGCLYGCDQHEVWAALFGLREPREPEPGRPWWVHSPSEETPGAR